MSEYWGYHLVLDCKGGKKFTKNPKEEIKTFIKELVEKIDMVAYGEPNIAYLPTPDTPEKSGWSVAQLIYTSTITCHFTDESGDFYLDVFSCKEFEIEKVTECVDEFFSPLETRSRYLLRQ